MYLLARTAHRVELLQRVNDLFFAAAQKEFTAVFRQSHDCATRDI